MLFGRPVLTETGLPGWLIPERLFKVLWENPMQAFLCAVKAVGDGRGCMRLLMIRCPVYVELQHSLPEGSRAIRSANGFARLPVPDYLNTRMCAFIGTERSVTAPRTFLPQTTFMRDGCCVSVSLSGDLERDPREMASGMQVTPCWGQWRVISLRDLSCGGRPAAPDRACSGCSSKQRKELGRPQREGTQQPRPGPMCSQS
ncbi:hypothetical protein MHYP_G00237740 [Metynnis hypsauchen]